MTSIPVEVTPQLVRKLDRAADKAFNMVLRDILRVNNGVYDYPVGAIALDETGVMNLGEGVSQDVRTGNPEAHAELEALKRAASHPFETRFIVTTMESCVMCQQGITHQLGHGGLIAYVTSRSVAEELGHVNARPTTDNDSIDGVRSLQLTHPRLQAKGLALLEEHVVSRDKETGLTDIDPRGLQSIFEYIDKQHPFDNTVYPPAVK